MRIKDGMTQIKGDNEVSAASGEESRPVSPLVLAQELGAAVTRFRRVLRRATRRSWPYEPLPRAELDLLRLAAEQPGISVAEAASALSLAPNTVSTLVNQVRRAGLLARDNDSGDRRVARLSLTDAGKARLAAWRDKRAEQLANAFNALDESDRRAVAAALPALARLTEKLEQGVPGNSQ